MMTYDGELWRLRGALQVSELCGLESESAQFDRLLYRGFIFKK